MALLQQTAELELDNEGRASLSAGGAAFYGIIIERIDDDSTTAHRGFPVDLYETTASKQSRRVTGPRALYFDAATPPAKLEMDARPGNGRKGDRWRVTFALAPGEVLGQGGAKGARGRQLVAAGEDTLIAKDAPDLYMVAAPETYYLYPDGTMGVGLAKPWDLRAYERVELHFQQSAPPQDADGALLFRLKAATSSTFTAAKPEIAGHTVWETGDFGDNGDLHGFIELGGKAGYVTPSFKRYAVAPPAFAHVQLSWAGTGGLVWAADQRAELRLYGYAR